MRGLWLSAPDGGDSGRRLLLLERVRETGARRPGPDRGALEGTVTPALVQDPGGVARMGPPLGSQANCGRSTTAGSMRPP